MTGDIAWGVVVTILLLGAILAVLWTIGSILADLLREVKAFRLDYLIGLDRLHERSAGPLTDQLGDIKTEIETIKDVIEDVVSSAKQKAR